MDPVTLSILAAGAAQMIGGAIRRKNRPEYKIPTALNQLLGNAQFDAASPYAPGYSQAVDQVDTTTANAIQAAAETGNIQDVLPAIVAQQNRANLDLQAANAADQNQDEQILLQALQRMAQAQDMEFQMNEFAPYADAYNESREMIGAGATNVVNGLTLSALMPQTNSNLGVKPKQNPSTGQMAPLLRMMLMNAGGPIL